MPTQNTKTNEKPKTSITKILPNNKESIVAKTINLNKPKTLSYDKGMIFFQQFLKKILLHIEREESVPSSENNELYFKTLITLTPIDINTIKEFANANEENAKNYLNEAHHIISKSFSHLSLQTDAPPELTWSFENALGISPRELLIVSRLKLYENKQLNKIFKINIFRFV